MRMRTTVDATPGHEAREAQARETPNRLVNRATVHALRRRSPHRRAPEAPLGPGVEFTEEVGADLVNAYGEARCLATAAHRRLAPCGGRVTILAQQHRNTTTTQQQQHLVG